MENKYLTIENSFIIYDRLKNEVNIIPGKTPYLWGNILIGNNDICLSEKDGVFAVFIKNIKENNDIVYFTDIKSAVDYLLKYYEDNLLVDNIDVMRNIFYETYGIELVEEESMQRILVNK